MVYLKHKNVLLIGDSCIDKFIYGSCYRLSPEGPSPIFIPERTVTNDGMAGNVKQNLEALGLDVDFITNEESITKTRFIEDSRNHLLLRVDEEKQLSPYKEIDRNIQKYDCVVISDYNKGFLTEDMMEKILTLSKLSFIDTKKILGNWVTNADFIKLNQHEYDIQSPSIKKLDNLIITLGKDGCKYNDIIYPTEKVDIRDVAGAGDTFLAGLVVKYLGTKDIDHSIEFAQKCARNVVTKKGVVTPK